MLPVPSHVSSFSRNWHSIILRQAFLFDSYSRYCPLITAACKTVITTILCLYGSKDKHAKHALRAMLRVQAAAAVGPERCLCSHSRLRVCPWRRTDTNSLKLREFVS
jgi:hypothetical protein